MIHILHTHPWRWTFAQLKVERDASIEPPIQTDCFLSAGAIILFADWAIDLIFLEKHSGNPENSVLATSRENQVGPKLILNVLVTLYNGIVTGFMNANNGTIRRAVFLAYI